MIYFELVKIDEEKKKGIYHINNANKYRSSLKEFLKGLKGISTKYLHKYLVWYKFIN